MPKPKNNAWPVEDFMQIDVHWSLSSGYDCRGMPVANQIKQAQGLPFLGGRRPIFHLC
jgi:hypothetical protein